MMYSFALRKLFNSEFKQLDKLDRLQRELQTAPGAEQPIITGKIDALMEEITQSIKMMRDYKASHVQGA